MRVMEGVTLTAPVKEDILVRMKLSIEQDKLTLPGDTRRLLVQITSQRCEPTKSGTLKFSHPTGTHDDCLWALVLAVYANQDITPARYAVAHTRSFG
jgi:phage FluMu gp28-like protein